MNIYIPFLPIPMWETLHAIFPFIIGMSKNYLKFIIENLCVADKVIVDLDDNIIYYDDDLPNLLLPQSFKDYIVSKMSQIMQKHKEYKDIPLSQNVKYIKYYILFTFNKSS